MNDGLVNGKAFHTLNILEDNKGEGLDWLQTDNISLPSQSPLQGKKTVTLIATAVAKDIEMRARIKHHKNSRPHHQLVIEEPLSLTDALIKPLDNNDYIIIDCLTLWVTSLLLDEDKTALERETSALLDILSESAGTVTIVSNETSMGIIPMGELTWRFCDETGVLHQELASQCDHVVLTISGLPMPLKGSL